MSPSFRMRRGTHRLSSACVDSNLFLCFHSGAMNGCSPAVARRAYALVWRRFLTYDACCFRGHDCMTVDRAEPASLDARQPERLGNGARKAPSFLATLTLSVSLVCGMVPVSVLTQTGELSAPVQDCPCRRNVGEGLGRHRFELEHIRGGHRLRFRRGRCRF